MCVYRKANKDVRLLYIKEDMKIMGYLFENIQENIKNVDVEYFVENFMRSILRAAMDGCDPQLLNMASINVLERYLELGVDIKLTKQQEVYKPNELYWVGSAYAYISVHKDVSSKDLIKILPFKVLLGMYTIGHEMSYNTFFNHLEI